MLGIQANKIVVRVKRVGELFLFLLVLAVNLLEVKGDLMCLILFCQLGGAFGGKETKPVIPGLPAALAAVADGNISAVKARRMKVHHSEDVLVEFGMCGTQYLYRIFAGEFNLWGFLFAHRHHSDQYQENY